MDRLTRGLIVVAFAIGLMAARSARRRSEDQRQAAPQAQTPREEPRPSSPVKHGQGMVILRNEHLDDGIAVRSPFNGDRGIAQDTNGREDRR